MAPQDHPQRPETVPPAAITPDTHVAWEDRQAVYHASEYGSVYRPLPTL